MRSTLKLLTKKLPNATNISPVIFGLKLEHDFVKQLQNALQGQALQITDPVIYRPALGLETVKGEVDPIIHVKDALKNSSKKRIYIDATKLTEAEINQTLQRAKTISPNSNIGLFNADHIDAKANNAVPLDKIKPLIEKFCGKEFDSKTLDVLARGDKIFNPENNPFASPENISHTRPDPLSALKKDLAKALTREFSRVKEKIISEQGLSYVEKLNAENIRDESSLKR
ncbi:MAG: hypothetical protein HON42_02695 [Alphaproteobacteria bacterium]|jgi:hypothetical protein|nr:hypothetical protein [Alphaproteobacteria bacterium]MBT5828273.1 hypothetical protein [Alphaproteobacteria bacterium]